MARQQPPLPQRGVHGPAEPTRTDRPGAQKDRPGHDHRYAIDATKLSAELGSHCSVGFEDGLSQTVHWYLGHETWWRDVTSGTYQAWIDKNYGFRIAV